MRTTRLLTVSGGLPSEGVCLLRWVCLLRGGGLPPEVGLPPEGGLPSKGGLILRGTPSEGIVERLTCPVDRMTDTCKTLPFRNFVCGR